jgi:hypothetical protein
VTFGAVIRGAEDFANWNETGSNVGVVVTGVVVTGAVVIGVVVGVVVVVAAVLHPSTLKIISTAVKAVKIFFIVNLTEFLQILSV